MNLNVIHTRQAVNQGDHGQDMTVALDIDPTMTVGELAEKYLTRRNYSRAADAPERVANGDAFLVIRLAVSDMDASW